MLSKYEFPTVQVMRVYEVRPRKDHRGINLISDALPFGRLCYRMPNAVSHVIDYATFRSRSHDSVIRLYNGADNVIETNKHAISKSGKCANKKPPRNEA